MQSISNVTPLYGGYSLNPLHSALTANLPLRSNNQLTTLFSGSDASAMTLPFQAASAIAGMSNGTLSPLLGPPSTQDLQPGGTCQNTLPLLSHSPTTIISQLIGIIQQLLQPLLASFESWSGGVQPSAVQTPTPPTATPSPGSQETTRTSPSNKTEKEQPWSITDILNVAGSIASLFGLGKVGSVGRTVLTKAIDIGKKIFSFFS